MTFSAGKVFPFGHAAAFLAFTIRKNFAERNSAPQMRRVSDIFLCICVCIHSGAFFCFIGNSKGISYEMKKSPPPTWDGELRVATQVAGNRPPHMRCTGRSPPAPHRLLGKVEQDVSPPVRTNHRFSEQLSRLLAFLKRISNIIPYYRPFCPNME